MKTPFENKPSLKAKLTGNLVTASMGYGGVAMRGGLENIETKAIVLALRMEKIIKGVYSGRFST